MPRLRLALNYLVVAKGEQRHNSINFLNYWLAIEIMLGKKDKEKLSSALKNKFTVLSDDVQTFEKMWELRNKIVHTGETLNAEHQELHSVENISKELFSKLLAASSVNVNMENSPC